MVIFKGLNVAVCVNNQPLQEYADDDEDQSPNTITKFIEAVSGAEFVLRMNFDPNFKSKAKTDCTGATFRACLDGMEVESYLLECSKNTENKVYMDGSRRMEEGKCMLERFRFSEIQICMRSNFPRHCLNVNWSEAEEASTAQKDSKKVVDSLGVITMKVFRARNISDPYPTLHQKGAQLTSNAFSEKALKGRALTHRASLGQPEIIPQYNLRSCDYIDNISTPFAVFNFKYRSRKALQTLYIIPRSPFPVPLEQRPRDQLTREELLELLSRRPVETKQDPAHSTKDEIRIKRERDPEYDAILSSARPQKVAKIDKPVEVVDLLD